MMGQIRNLAIVNALEPYSKGAGSLRLLATLEDTGRKTILNQGHLRSDFVPEFCGVGDRYRKIVPVNDRLVVKKTGFLNYFQKNITGAYTKILWFYKKGFDAGIDVMGGILFIFYILGNKVICAKEDHIPRIINNKYGLLKEFYKLVDNTKNQRSLPYANIAYIYLKSIACNLFFLLLSVNSGWFSIKYRNYKRNF